MRSVTVAPLLLSCVVGAGCASGGAVPRPFPGASAPPTAPREAEAPSQAPLPGLIATALSLRGIPYLNGGSDPSHGFDCSGFVQWVFAQHGTSLPREVREQYEEGKRVGQKDVEAGDLVFFETVSKGPSHVGIALGTGEFVHAPSSRGVVRVEHYTNGYWASRWVGARRIRASS